MNKDLIISKYKELVSDLALSLQSIKRELGNRVRINSSLDKELNEIAIRVEKTCAELSLLQEQEKELPIDKNYVAMDKVNEICDKAERDIELENKLIDFANWYLRLIKVTTDKDERHDIENRGIVWSFLRGDDYKLWWNKFGKSVDQSGIREELIKFRDYLISEWKYEYVTSICDGDIDEYLKAKER